MAHEIATTFACPPYTSDGNRCRCSGIKVRTTSASVKDTRSGPHGCQRRGRQVASAHGIAYGRRGADESDCETNIGEFMGRESNAL
jgi:hypothetical protein